MKNSPTTWKVRHIISLVKDGKLVPRPEFQRRLVWKASDKDHFLDTILKGYPFPEIYVADGVVDVDSGEGEQLLVDGLQRVSTITDYFAGDPNLKLRKTLPYSELPTEAKQRFLQYDVAVRDLGDATPEEIVEVFQRINATDYALTDIEVNNARYRGEMKDLAEEVADHSIFAEHRVFNSLDYRRMGDLRFALSLIISVMSGYFTRDENFEKYLEAYNESFSRKDEIKKTLFEAFEFIEEVGFGNKSRVWRKADLFTMLVELAAVLNDAAANLLPSDVVDRIIPFYEEVNEQELGSNSLSGIYYKAALQASNDRLNRMRRGIIVGGLMRGISQEAIKAELEKQTGGS